MRKIVLFLLFAGFLNGNIYGQAKQAEVLLKQIAALQIYIGYAQKGYSVAKKGLNTIGDFKRGEFNLQTDYFNSLKTVNPKIKKYARVAEIISLQVKIIKSYGTIYGQIQQDDLFHGDEVDYIKRVFDRLIENCDDNLEELITIVTDGQLEMKDDERMKRIDAIYQNMLENHTFCESFSNQTRLMSLSRTKDTKEVKTSRALRGINTDLP
ncbi:hypothetical protein [Flavobacterium algoritolerans]|uniref:TerB family tellurite resistance protein n=1 Tax=Flavobacterium algoritolerans TaxID=3041254 RepID=A0ABT6V9C0_9FLAO|nr:hypothetical protein [Flavobacterium algoritolerans]MDI5894838.1 hypothetical protein [Flavobacterium algoritolerans]